MGFDVPVGTRGARQPRAGMMMRFINNMAAGRIRRSGKVTGFSALILTTVGAKTGAERTNPVGWFPARDGGWLIVASAAGAIRNPAWYHNIAAHPDQVRIEVNGRTIPVTAEQLHGPERDEAWAQIVAAVPRFGRYQGKTDRQLPVILLTERPAS
jgi:deazaflavin-dependent oxidoreductase (nitroreductase family)